MNNPNWKLYLEFSISVPEKEAQKNISDFQDELGKLRERFKIRDLAFVIATPIEYENGGIGDGMTWGGLGDILKMESLLAFAYGQAAKDRQETISKFLSGKKEPIK